MTSYSLSIRSLLYFPADSCLRERSPKSLRESYGFLALIPVLACLIGLSACDRVPLSQTGPQPSFHPGESPPASGKRLIIALLLPLSQEGNDNIAPGMWQSAQLALEKSDGKTAVSLTVEDTGGTAQGAYHAAQRAIEYGAELIIGPLFSHEAVPVSRLARRHGIPVISFSTDSNLAGDHVYLLSFLPRENIAWGIHHRIEQGDRAFAAFVPQSPYGDLAISAIREALGTKNAALTGIVSFPYSAAPYPHEPAPEPRTEDIDRLVTLLLQTPADTLFLPMSPDDVSYTRLLNALREAKLIGPSASRPLSILGSGQWENTAQSQDPALTHAQYAAPDPTLWPRFSQLFIETFHTRPHRIATLAFDAVSLAIALSHNTDFLNHPFDPSFLTRKAGFNGVDGYFYFSKSGLSHRYLAIMEIQDDGRSKVIVPPPFPDHGSDNRHIVPPSLLTHPFLSSFPLSP